jgi:TRAP-type uncharacterized transport system substrate-binding protein
MKKILTLALICATTMAMAAAPDAAPAECEGVKMASGAAGKGYSLLVADLIKACGSTVQICEVNTGGGLDNLNALSVKDADVGIAQLDTINAMKAGDENVSALQAVASLNYNYLHVVVAANGFSVAGEKKYGFIKGDAKTFVMQRFSDLKGQRVALVGSAQLLGQQLNRSLGYNMQTVDVDTDAKAFEMVKKGEVAAALSVSGWPSGSIKNLKQDSGLSLVPFDAPSAAPYVVRPVNYKGLGVYNNNSLAVPNVLLTRPFKGEKAQSVAALKSCIGKQLQNLQEGSYQPAWNEIKSLDNTFDLPKFAGQAVIAKAKK